MRKYPTITLFAIVVMLCSCSSKRLMTISVIEPASVYIPSASKKVGIVNRSLPSEKNKTIDKLDKILSAEGKNMDRDGADKSVIGLFDELVDNNRFSEVKVIDSVDVRSPGSGVFPAALSWDKVAQICSDNKVNILFVLSFYDTDTKVNYQAVPVQLNGPLGVKIPAIEHHATVATVIKTGWRIYDLTHKVIRDEFLVNESVVLKGKGINPLSAVKAVMGRKEAVLQISNNMGHSYALRILPYRVRVSRHYYVRGTDNFKIAKRRAQTGDWDGAAELWDREVINPKRKIAGRACYNMAIINEINGDLDEAVKWASRSYTDYKDKLGLKYLNQLKYRIKRNRQLEQQKQ